MTGCETYLLLGEALLAVGAAKLAEELIIREKGDAGVDVGAGDASPVVPALANAALKLHLADRPLLVAITVDRVGAFRWRRPADRPVRTFRHFSFLHVFTRARLECF